MTRGFLGGITLVTALILCSSNPLAAQQQPSKPSTATPGAAYSERRNTAGPAGACLVGPGFAATLLVPYFEVDMSSPGGVNTLISVNNGWETPALARMVVWTDWGIPTLAFDIYLQGFDVQTISFRDLLNGAIPSTGAEADLEAFEYCDILPPHHDNPALSTNQIGQLVASHSGVPGPLNFDCAGETFGDGIARGYATIDVVDECSGLEGYNPLFTPANTTYPYFSEGGGGKGIAITDNQLWGDVAYVDFSNSFAQGSELIGIWADPDQFEGDDIYTFYGRYSDWDGRDERVPLPWRWNQRFLNGGPFAGGASLIVWRDTRSPAIATIPCGAVPAWWPLTSRAAAMNEEAGSLVDLTGFQAFNLATQKVNVSRFELSYDSGWMQIGTPRSQSWIQTSLSAHGLYSATFNGIPDAFLCTELPP